MRIQVIFVSLAVWEIVGSNSIHTGEMLVDVVSDKKSVHILPASDSNVAVVD